MQKALKSIVWARSMYPTGHLHGLMGHVHYYTTQWKVSVGWKLGRGKDFWLGLPKRLRAAESDEAAFKAILSELDKAVAVSNAAIDAATRDDHIRQDDLVRAADQELRGS